jgi:hypothetical protein
MSGLIRLFLVSSTAIILGTLETKGADFLCQALEVLRRLTAYGQVFPRNQRSLILRSSWLFGRTAWSLQTEALFGCPIC